MCLERPMGGLKEPDRQRFWRVRVERAHIHVMHDSTATPTCTTCRHGLEIAGTAAHPYWYCPQCRISALTKTAFYQLHESANESSAVSQYEH